MEQTSISVDFATEAIRLDVSNLRVRFSVPLGLTILDHLQSKQQLLSQKVQEERSQRVSRYLGSTSTDTKKLCSCQSRQLCQQKLAQLQLDRSYAR